MIQLFKIHFRTNSFARFFYTFFFKICIENDEKAQGVRKKRIKLLNTLTLERRKSVVRNANCSDDEAIFSGLIRVFTQQQTL